MTHPLPEGYTAQPGPDHTQTIIAADGQHAGHIAPDHLGRPLPHDRTGHPMQAFPRLETWDEAAERVARSDLAHRSRLPHHHTLAAMAIPDIAARSWDHAHHIATTGTNHAPHSDGTPWLLSDEARTRSAAFIARNPDRDTFIAAQTSGRNTALASSTEPDILAEHIHVGDHVWACAAPQIHPYGWREVVAVHHFDHGNGARITVRTAKGPDPHMDLHLERDHTALVRR